MGTNGKKSYDFPVIINTNSQSLVPRIDELTLYLKNNNVDIACITETWLKSTVPSSVINIDGYDVLRNDRRDDVIGGGVCIYIRNGIKYKLWKEMFDDNIEAIWITIRPKRLMITLGVLYMPPGSSVRHRRDAQHVSHIIHCLDTICKLHPDTGILVVGDFNHMKDKYIKSFPLKQIVNVPTHVNSIIDCIYTNLSNYYDVPILFPGLGLSLHKMVCCIPHDVKPNKCTVTLTHRTNSHTAKSAFVASLKKVSWLLLYSMTSCQDMFYYFNYHIQSLLNKHLPHRSIIKYQTDKPWVTEEYKQLITQRQAYFRCGNSVQYNILRNSVNRASKSLRSRYYKNNVQSMKTCNPGKWWQKTFELLGLPMNSYRSESFNLLAEDQCDGDMNILVNDMNNFSNQYQHTSPQ